jgi:tRNA(Arg) A34 adenosine deaminase TadA
MKMTHNFFMDEALKIASQAKNSGDVPVGAVIVMDNKIIAKAGNRVEIDHDPTAHAEMLVIKEAGKILKSTILNQCSLYVTLEPCSMCAQAIAFARIKHLYFGAYDPKGGGVLHGPRIFNQPTCHHKPEVYGGIMESRASDLLKDFFRNLRP